jgi:hypothetical protein
MIIRRFRLEGLWPPAVPVEVLVECLAGDPRDAATNRFLKTCNVLEVLPERVARRAARARSQARRGSAVDAIVAVTAEPGGTVITGDSKDLKALAAQLAAVQVIPV